MKQLKIASIGCGNRARVYLNLMSEQLENFEITAVADPITKRTDAIKMIASKVQVFESAETLLNYPKLADVIIIATHDNYHYEPCKRAIEKGYDIILEKPICEDLGQIIELEQLAQQYNTRIIVCHVLRYTSFYKKLKETIDSGVIGDVVSLNASEGIEPWHFAHSYVRGHWAIMENATPTIVAKCCHDMDILQWLIQQKCEKVSSFGELSFFKNTSKLERGDDMYDSKRYLEPQMRVWLDQVFDNPEASNIEILDWLKTSPWGRNVFDCDNTAPDHQVLNLEFKNKVTATFTMTAFDEGRNYEIYGTKGSLRAGDFCAKHIGADILITNHASKNVTKLNVQDQNPHNKYGGYHYGGDVGFVKELHSLFTSNEEPNTSIESSVHSHVIAFAAEESRRKGITIDLKKFYLKNLNKLPEHALY